MSIPMENYRAERFEHYRAMGEDYGDATEWADQDTRAKFNKAERCDHVWVGGMCYVDPEDLEVCATAREVTCEHCDHVATKGIDF